MSCCKCNERTWIEIEDSQYCKRHGEARLAELRLADQRKREFVRKSPRDGQCIVKMRHNNRWVVVEGLLNSMELAATPQSYAGSISDRTTVLVSKAADMLKLEVLPNKITQHESEPQV